MKNRQRNHTLSEKKPLLSMLLSILTAALVCALGSSLGSSDIGQYLLLSVAAVLCLLAHKLWFSPQFKGFFKPEIPFREIGILCLPFLVQLLLSWLLNVIDYGRFFKASRLSIAMALSAGFGEETMFRGLAIPIGMRYIKGKNKILTAALFTSVIFGLSHLGNIKVGANVGMAVVQAAATIGTGLLYAAICLRTGSILITIVMHSLYDWMCFVTNPVMQEGSMAGLGVSFTIIVSLFIDFSMGIAGYCMIRPAVREKIEEVWQMKWQDYAVEAEADSAHQGKR